jgi:2-haloacid dehalogenase
MTTPEASLRTVLGQAEVLTFDCYGTLIDWALGLSNSFRIVFGEWADEHREELFSAYVGVEASFERPPYNSYRDIVTKTLVRLAERFSRKLSVEQHDSLARLLPGWVPFADTNEALARLQRRYRLGILSNIDRDLFAGTARHFSITFDCLICAEDVRSYKPGLAHFRTLAEKEGGLGKIVHVAQSLFHDGVPAKQLDLAFVWINRYNERNGLDVTPLAEFRDLKSLADAADAA